MSLEDNGEDIVKGTLDVEEVLTDFFLEKTKKDKRKIGDIGNETLNVEGILADFFLNKMEKQNLNSDSDSGKRSKKHKKHKSKKSKNKHRKSRSFSSERKINYVKNIGDHSSSEERELQRLQKLKKLDIKENKFDSTVLNIHRSINDNVSGKNNTESIANSLTQTDEPSVSGQTFTSEVNHEITKNNFQIVSVNTADVIDKGDSPSKFHQNRSMTDLKNLNSLDAVSTSSKEEGSSKEGICSNEVDSTVKDINNFESKNIAQCSSRSSSSSDNEKKVQPNRSETEHSSSRSKSKHKHHSRERSHSRSRKRKRSRHRSRESQGSYEKYSHRKRKRSSSKKHHKSHSTSSSSDRSVSRSRYRSRSRSNSWDYYRYEHSRRNSKSRHEKESKLHSSSKAQDKDTASSRSRIDQAKILQIAQKNVLNMIEKGTLPQGLSIDNFKREQIVSLKSGGKSVQELTDFCMKLSKKENDSEEEQDTKGNDRSKDLAFIHHPFKVKESSTIKLNIKNAVQIPIKTHAEKVAETARLSSQFPVSSGNQHKQKELEWVPVEPPTKNIKLSEKNNSIVPASQTISSVPMLTTKETKTPDVVSSVQQSSDVSSAIPFPQSDTSDVSVPPPLPPAPLDLPPPPPPPPQMFNTMPQTSNQLVQLNSTDNYYALQSYNYSATVTNNMFPHSTSLTQSSSVSYSFPTSSSFRSQKPVDVASIVTQRFKALTKLQSNPNDIEALNALQEAQANIQNWVESQHVPGLFTGTTGAKPLSVEELSGPKHWNYRAKKDIFTRAAPVTEGKGMSLLKKMGWNPGEGLGKNKEGSLEPLVLDIKTDKRGLVSEGEGSKRAVSSVLKELQGKHPVSALMELCSKRKWKPPLYTLIEESGPPHKRTFLFKVEVNNVEYQSANPVNNKKVAKADAAVICLQALSIFPKS